MFDYERFKILSRGEDTPQNAEEQSWLDNSRKSSQKAAEKMIEMDKLERKNREKAYHEYYALIKSSFPKDFFCKNPMAVEEYYRYTKSLFPKITTKAKFILNTPILRKKYNIPPKSISYDESGSFVWLYQELEINSLSKKLKSDIKKASVDFEKYKTPEFIEKANKIQVKYDIHLDYVFDVYFWCTDYAEYRDYKA